MSFYCNKCTIVAHSIRISSFSPNNRLNIKHCKRVKLEVQFQRIEGLNVSFGHENNSSKLSSQ